MILTLSDLAELTGKVRRSAQARVLRHLGIPFKTRPNGSLVVFQHDLPHICATAATTWPINY